LKSHNADTVNCGDVGSFAVCLAVWWFSGCLHLEIAICFSDHSQNLALEVTCALHAAALWIDRMLWLCRCVHWLGKLTP
jgi:hypothetical protein